MIKADKISYVCSKCGNTKDLIDLDKSNKNWKVSKQFCPICKGPIKFHIKYKPLKKK
jgi:DNA-directed RNA polymerase subunit RPC12/RpoP